MTANDHTVPQFYLKRFAGKGTGKYPRLMAAGVDQLDAAFPTGPRSVAAVKGFHWGTTPAGVPHHTMERLMTSIENAAARAFSEVLDTAWALPERWPPATGTRVALSWWVAAQILRTTRQRHRVDHLAEEAARNGLPEALNPPTGPLHKFARHNRHLGFIGEHLAPLAAIVGSKPWGIGFSDVCLPTSDVPVVLMNGQDDENQLLPVAYWDVLVPLDPHRFLLMTRRGSQEDPATWVDHRLKMDGGMGVFLTDMLWSAAEQHVFWHPDHEPYGLRESHTRGPRLPRPWAGDTHSPPQMIMEYGAMSPDTTVERRWMQHPAREADLGGSRADP